MMGQEYFCPKCRDGALAEVAGSATERAAPPVAARGRSKRLRSSRKTSAHRTSGPRRAVSGGAGRTSGPG